MQDDDDDFNETKSTVVASQGYGDFSFNTSGPPPDMRKRQLVFDSLGKIVSSDPKKGQKGKNKGESRGTYVFTWGAGYQGQLGRKFGRGQAKYTAVPMMVELNIVVRQVACGGLHTAVVTEAGKVYTWGDGKNGELGHHHDPSLKQIPRLVENLDNVFVSYVACGGSHTVALTDAGLMYTWGKGKNGQLGHSDRQTIKTPRRVDHPLARFIKAVAAGNKHTIVINKKGEAFAFGCGKHGQTGLGVDADVNEPTQISRLADQKMSFVGCGAIHSCLINEEGELFLCGFGEYFHPNESQHFFYTPTKIDLPEPVVQVACGQSHNVALTVTGDVYAWGSGEYGQIGYGIKGNLAAPRLVLEGKNVAQINAGRYHSFALTDSGILYSWGCGENGQLGLGKDENVTLPSIVTTIIGTIVGQVSCGEHHTAVLTSAPWSKTATDVNRWHHAAKIEHELKLKYLEKTHRGLTARDLAKLAEEMAKWHMDNELKKKEIEEETKAEQQDDINSIARRRLLRDEMADELEKTMEKNNGQFAAPSSVTADNLDKEDDAKTSDAKKQSKGFNNTKKKNTLKNSPPSTYRKSPGKNPAGMKAVVSSARSVRDEDSLAKTSFPGEESDDAPLARVAFLKETAQMVKRMTSVIADKGEAQNQRQLAKMLRLVFELRKESDNHRAVISQKEEVIAKAKQELKLMDQTSGATDRMKNDTESRLAALKMQLNTVTIKIAETGENRRNYELNIAHLKEEDFDHFNQLKLLRRDLQDTNNFFKKMNDLKLQSMETQNKAEIEYAEFQEDIANYQEFVQSQLSQFRMLLDQTSQETRKRENTRSVQTGKQREKLELRISKLNAEAEEVEREGAGLQERLTSLDLKLRHFEDSFQKITAATGLSHPDAIVNKFFFKGEIKEQLQTEIDDKQERIAELKREDAALKATLDETKRSYVEDRWRDVETNAEATRETEVRSIKSKKEAHRTTARLAFTQEGVLSLFKTIVRMTGTDKKVVEDMNLENGELWNPDQSQQIFDKTVTLLQDVSVKIEEIKKRRDEMEALQKETDKEVEQKKLPFGLSLEGLKQQIAKEEAEEAAASARSGPKEDAIAEEPEAEAAAVAAADEEKAADAAPAEEPAEEAAAPVEEPAAE